MGYNTTVVVINDAIADIRDDKDFGRKLADAIRELPAALHHGRGRVDVSAGSHVNAAHVVETHHADQTAVVTVGGNLGIEQATHWGWDHHTNEGAVKVLRTWAAKLGYELVKKSP